MNSVSVTGKKWVLKKFNVEEVNYIKTNFLLDETISKLLVLKQVKKENINNYLNPLIKNILPNPNILKDMDKATDRAVQAIVKNEKIGIFGDYDVDGASSTALIGEYFNLLKKDFEIYIPDRKKEGYGPSIEGFDFLLKKGSNLIFTVDCGTLSFKPIDYLFQKKKGRNNTRSSSIRN